MLLDTLVLLFVGCGDTQSWVSIKITTGSSPGSEVFYFLRLNLQQTNRHKWFYGEDLRYVFNHSFFPDLVSLSSVSSSGGFFSRQRMLHQ